MTEYDATSNVKPVNQSTELILLIDDDKDVLYSLRDLLELEGEYVVETATDIDSALTLAELQSPRLAFIDIRLGSGSGLELISLLKRKVPGISCIMMTAYRDVDYAVKALRADADDYLFKPIDPDRLLAVTEEIFHQRRINQVKMANERNITNILDHASGFIFILSPTGHCIEAGYAALSFIDQDWNEVRGNPFSQTPWWQKADIDIGEVARAVENAAAGNAVTFETRLTNKNNESVWYEFSLKPIIGNNKQVSLIIVEGRDLTKYKNIEQNLKKMSLFDSLTGLANRALLNEHLDLAFARYERSSGRFSVMFIDLDNFKAVNDTLGHQAGDELLVNVGQCLKACLRDEDIIARVGGDEFVIVVNSESDRKGIIKVSGRLIQAITALNYKANNDNVISASIGIAEYPGDGRGAETILKNADAAMYTAKRKGKNRFQFFSDE
jgi:diguanylate cyclase (GGDEF)-like protein